MEVEHIEKYLSINKTNFDNQILEYINNNKMLAVNEGNEDLANYMWCLNKIFKIQKNYISAYNLLKNKEFQDAWLLLDRIEIDIYLLSNNFDISSDKYNIEYILDRIHDFQKLYPYEYFISRESIIKSEKCTICGRKVGIRHSCGHKKGRLYNGELCLHKVTDFEFRGMVLVKNPFDKFAYIQIEDKEYNYGMIELLINELHSPYEKWHIEDTKIKKIEYLRIGRNELCPCGSNRKYKKCCKDTDKELMTHYIIVFDNPEGHKRMPLTTFSTYK